MAIYNSIMSVNTWTASEFPNNYFDDRLNPAIVPSNSLIHASQARPSVFIVAFSATVVLGGGAAVFPDPKIFRIAFQLLFVGVI